MDLAGGRYSPGRGLQSPRVRALGTSVLRSGAMDCRCRWTACVCFRCLLCRTTVRKVSSLPRESFGKKHTIASRPRETDLVSDGDEGVTDRSESSMVNVSTRDGGRRRKR